MKLLSIIIPALNEESYIEETIKALQNHTVSETPYEVIVVDGGSSDLTRELSRKCGAKVIESNNIAKGKAQLLNQGAEMAKGDVFLFCDADSIAPMGYDEDIIKIFKDQRNVAGAYEFKLNGLQFGLRVVEFINCLRYRIWKRYYGDQGIFVRKDVFVRAGGFPDVALMEASDLCVQLSKFGKLRLVKKPMLTSPRRFIERGIYRVLWFDIRMWWLNLYGYNVEKYAHEYWSIS